ncbi:type II toxin-antitoxin system PemK/MazF family toxin [Micromonospora sp. WMMD882]|uniref:type II toxin-antitoxin system PemK/MazF family toxin n=1 Tax=Micromonospora sp. WMMD882 TaxID=3015151 RepID=UPI00248BDC2C|nr:type II toxin-antitoxin system PemK/MazF family toxin [Micromonospora sp. WMMD882]WBB82040.1 type II toxin-antitoxin system PemK/MazF family toxin [Micromonospora sp. WMMD882]
MPEWLLWTVAVLAAVAAGWAWSGWRHRVGHGPDAGRPDRRRPGRGRPDRRRPGRPDVAPRPRDRRSTDAGTPRRGDIWWAEVPYADGTGAKVRPCLVLRADRRGADVLRITSQDKSHRDDHVRIPTRDWDPRADHDSFLDLSEPVRIDADAFRTRAGVCDPALHALLP